MTIVSGIFVAAVLTYLPGTGGHRPAEGFTTGATPVPKDLFGVFFAALATLSLGIVLGPEAPLIAIGGGLGVAAVSMASWDAPDQAKTVMAAAGSFAAISTLLGSPIVGAFLLMEATGLGGPTLGLVLVPGLLASGIGALIFIGLGSLSGFGTFALAIPDLPPAGHLTSPMFLWAVAIGVVATALGFGVQRVALALQPRVERARFVALPLAGVGVALSAIVFGEITGKPQSDVLFSGQTALPEIVLHAADWTVGALIVLLLLKAVAYALSLSGFRGGPIFPALLIGGAGGIAASHLPGLTLIPAVAMGIGAMCTVMLRLPMTSVLLPTLLLASDGIEVMPVTIVAVVTAYVVSARLPIPAHPTTGSASAPAPPRSGVRS